MKQSRYTTTQERQFFMDCDPDELPDCPRHDAPLSVRPAQPAAHTCPARMPVLRRPDMGAYRCVRRPSRHPAPHTRPHRWGGWQQLRAVLDRYGYYVAVGVCALMVCAGVAVGLSGGGVQPAPTASPAPVMSAAPDLIGDVPAAQASAGQGLLTGDEPERARLAMWPLEGEVLTAHVVDELIYLPTMRLYGTHAGIDIAGSEGQVVLACADSVVADCWRESLLGNVVELRCEGGMVLRYAGLTSLELARKGATVRAGDVIGAVGRSAMSESALPPHLHFEVLVDGVSVPPMEYLP